LVWRYCGTQIRICVYNITLIARAAAQAPRAEIFIVVDHHEDHPANHVAGRHGATLGRLEQVRTGGADALIRGLHRVTCGEKPQAPSVRFAPALAVGDTWMLHALWHKLGWDEAFRRVLRNAHGAFDAERLLRVMVFNRLCEPPRLSWRPIGLSQAATVVAWLASCR
jgi:hypothetical protein